MTDTPISLDKAITQGLSEVTRERTLSTHAQQMGSGNPKIINFRGDIAENYQYDKIKPLSSKAQAMGNVVIIQGESQKTGQREKSGNYRFPARKNHRKTRLNRQAKWHKLIPGDHCAPVHEFARNPCAARYKSQHQ